MWIGSSPHDDDFRLDSQHVDDHHRVLRRRRFDESLGSSMHAIFLPTRTIIFYCMNIFPQLFGIYFVKNTSFTYEFHGLYKNKTRATLHVAHPEIPSYRRARRRTSKKRWRTVTEVVAQNYKSRFQWPTEPITLFLSSRICLALKLITAAVQNSGRHEMHFQNRTEGN